MSNLLILNIDLITPPLLPPLYHSATEADDYNFIIIIAVCAGLAIIAGILVYCFLCRDDQQQGIGAGVGMGDGQVWTSSRAAGSMAYSGAPSGGGYSGGRFSTGGYSYSGGVSGASRLTRSAFI